MCLVRVTCWVLRRRRKWIGCFSVWLSAVCLQRETTSHSLPPERLQGQINPALHLATAMAIIKLITFHFIGPEVKCKSLSSIYSSHFYWHEILTTSRTWNKEERLAWEESAERGKFKSQDDELAFLKPNTWRKLAPQEQTFLTLLNYKKKKNQY